MRLQIVPFCKFGKIKDSEEKGIVIIHQELALIPYMTIGENMFLGNERGKKAFSLGNGLSDPGPPFP